MIPTSPVSLKDWNYFQLAKYVVTHTKIDKSVMSSKTFQAFSEYDKVRDYRYVMKAEQYYQQNKITDSQRINIKRIAFKFFSLRASGSSAASTDMSTTTAATTRFPACS